MRINGPREGLTRRGGAAGGPRGGGGHRGRMAGAARPSRMVATEAVRRAFRKSVAEDGAEEASAGPDSEQRMPPLRQYLAEWLERPPEGPSAPRVRSLRAVRVDGADTGAGLALRPRLTGPVYGGGPYREEGEGGFGSRHRPPFLAPLNGPYRNPPRKSPPPAPAIPSLARCP